MLKVMMGGLMLVAIVAAAARSCRRGLVSRRQHRSRSISSCTTMMSLSLSLDRLASRRLELSRNWTPAVVTDSRRELRCAPQLFHSRARE
jgi:hypothetical protein